MRFFKILVTAVCIVLIQTTIFADEMIFAKSQLQIITENGKNEFTVEVADSAAKQERGLMFRKNMPEKQGMIFLFDKELVVNMWMKSTYIPLDMVFIKKGAIISKIVANTVPLSLKTISSKEEVIAVLELKAGMCKKFAIRKNDKIIFQGLK